MRNGAKPGHDMHFISLMPSPLNFTPMSGLLPAMGNSACGIMVMTGLLLGACLTVFPRSARARAFLAAARFMLQAYKATHPP